MADDTMGQLVAEFRALGDADRRAILARLSFDERRRFEAALRPVVGDSYSADIAGLAAGGDGLTGLARTALAAAMAEVPMVAATSHRPTLLDRLWRR
ncbi:hypothetical protein ACFQ15_08160 [Sphingomonas hankookensis]|uniref:hypothetical protein n=1 Tax=Sphingomonas hankookensis TaxID=563996 RepID=UPI001F57B03A|nr:hypothetical protein [Sphingomonas hankookensis]